MPLLFRYIQLVLECGMELALCDGAFHGNPRRLRAEYREKIPVWRDQPFFGLMERSAVKSSWITELSLSLLMPISSEAAAITTQKAGWARI